MDKPTLRQIDDCITDRCLHMDRKDCHIALKDIEKDLEQRHCVSCERITTHHIDYDGSLVCTTCDQLALDQHFNKERL